MLLGAGEVDAVVCALSWLTRLPARAGDERGADMHEVRSLLRNVYAISVPGVVVAGAQSSGKSSVIGVWPHDLRQHQPAARGCAWRPTRR